ncbi:NAD-dependent succinate-semialdehyde dehydrogenase [Haematobacter massiliensis]|uniref:Succinate-semialdehyde dehydrogenase n=1 Tax=Haematobacter massiliensis TaxID=195105 RepID=A0A086Y544_9RHOB|nr:NAD-dependent succinate-semialdehyde dehydrogenase [Haematobacter massiliensis]KFI29394.1 succinate-semialdehyde dehydrogenase [Haematobacter massiliensis]OWJ71240.1 NAD-dependent succinate-semialdehyde dehydrogenase [Haematobacter massiliensis]OWJ84314.1 NAD-dependent succinate-semialdehyde dehydrogenase [Haematobacter massiliensis]QBJ26012.1 NAD-dependent succinate-semialdehyde dehydrogenase [Haematobacter massiliensis]
MKLTNSALLKSAAFVDGAWVEGRSGEWLDVTNPANGEVVGRVPRLGEAETEAAIAAADRAFGPWSKRAAKERSQLLRKWFDLIIANADDLALILTSEQGKPLAEAKGEIVYAASFIEWFAEEAKRVYGDTIPAPQADKRITVIRQPVGVTAAITPWNFPAAMITRKVGPALAAGCTMIVRPADLTPLTALALAVLAEEAGIPKGVLQVVTGKSSVIGKVLTGSETVRKLSFTGSTEVGRTLMAQCAPTIKKLSLELGGNAPLIVFDDADLDQAVEGTIASKYRNAGQTCVCANRILVQRGVYEEFTRRLVAKVEKMKVGPGTEEGVILGPLIEPAAIEKVEEHLADARAKGGKVVTGGERLGGLFISPAVVTGVTPEMVVAREETFGPVAPLFPFDTEEEAIRMANDTIFGLASYFFTKDFARSVRVAEALDYGIVGHNTGLISNEVAPFGGVKQSGLGREGSKFGIEDYLEMKYICSAV